MLRRIFLVGACFLATACVAQAGTLYVYLTIDPTSTAGAGIAPVSGGGTNLVVNSTRTGSGTWHLYAVDDTLSSNGIRSFNVKLNNATTIINRSTTGSWDDDPSFGNGSGPFGVGFNSVRSATNNNPIGGGQDVTNTVQIGGMGVVASNLQAQTNAQSYSGVTSGQWGNYNDGVAEAGTVAATGHVRNAILLGEGTYTGVAPTVDITTLVGNGGTAFGVWNPGLAGSTAVSAAGGVDSLSNTNPFVPEPATVSLLGLALLGAYGFIRRRHA